MASPEFPNDPELQPIDSFEWLSSAVKAKFVDALFEQRDNPGFRYIAMPYRHPDLDEPLALFAVVDNTETGDVVDRVRNRIGIGVPVEALDIDEPFSNVGAEGHDSFIVFLQNSRNKEYSIIISREGFEEALNDRNSPLKGLAERIMLSVPFPLMQNR